MKKDFKIGLGLGLLFVIGVAIWLSTRTDLSTEARVLQKASNAPTPAAQTDDKPRTANTEPQTTNNEPRTMTNEQTTRIHIVQKGETLSGIAAKYYGSAAQWQKILAANLPNLADPNRLTPGFRLLIPE
jgi:5'-nucleotidase